MQNVLFGSKNWTIAVFKSYALGPTVYIRPTVYTTSHAIFLFCSISSDKQKTTFLNDAFKTAKAVKLLGIEYDGEAQTHIKEREMACTWFYTFTTNVKILVTYLHLHVVLFDVILSLNLPSCHHSLIPWRIWRKSYNTNHWQTHS